MTDKKMRKIFWRFYFSGTGFVYQGIWIWTGKDNLRIIPFNEFGKWGKEK